MRGGAFLGGALMCDHTMGAEGAFLGEYPGSIHLSPNMFGTADIHPSAFN